MRACQSECIGIYHDRDPSGKQHAGRNGLAPSRIRPGQRVVFVMLRRCRFLGLLKLRWATGWFTFDHPWLSWGRCCLVAHLSLESRYRFKSNSRSCLSAPLIFVESAFLKTKFGFISKDHLSWSCFARWSRQPNLNLRAKGVTTAPLGPDPF